MEERREPETEVAEETIDGKYREKWRDCVRAEEGHGR